jgi:N-acetyltransferase 10
MTQSIDARIEYILRLGISNNHRSLMVLIGSNAEQRLPTIHRLLSKHSISPIDSVIWCHKNEVTKKKSRALSAAKKSKQRIEDGEDELSVFMKTSDIEFIEYRESERILGQTVDMLVLQDFEALSPNLIATSMETVRGGGLIVLLLDNVSSIETLVTRRTDLLESVTGTEAFIPRYNKRLFRSLIDSKFTVFLDDDLNVLDITGVVPRDIASPTPSAAAPQETTGLEDPSLILRNLGRTRDQSAVIGSIFEMLGNRTGRAIYSITAARGRGKSAAMGVSVAQAINLKFSSVYIASPALENVKTVFGFIVQGLERIGYRRYVDFKIVHHIGKRKKLVERIEVGRGHKQVIEYINPLEELKYHPDLLIIDEAAAIPLAYLKRLLFPNLVVMATTVNGYEGTGRSFSVKMSEYLRISSSGASPFEYRELGMDESIRYAGNDPVERWLHTTLLLETTARGMEKCPAPRDCSLFYVDRDVLFCGQPAAEQFLNDTFSLFISSHYKNSPNDLQILADSPTHEIFTLLTPVEDNGTDLPRVICAIQVSFEGRCVRQGYSKEGNLIPWILSETHMDASFLKRYGLRIVRIATHPDYMSMGYGERALAELVDFVAGQSGGDATGATVQRSTGVLLYELEDVTLPSTDWMGVSFGITEQLYRFWSKGRFLPVGLRQTVSAATGEHSSIFLRSLSPSMTGVVDRYNRAFRSKLIRHLASCFRHFSPSLGLSLLHNDTPVKSDTPAIYFTEADAERLRMFSLSTIDYREASDLIGDVARMYFYGRIGRSLPVLSKAALLMVGCQNRSLEEAGDVLTLKSYQVSNILAKAIESMVEDIKMHILR